MKGGAVDPVKSARAWVAENPQAPGAIHVLSALASAERYRLLSVELAATLANERGEGEPPSPGWEWTDCAGWGWCWARNPESPGAWVAVTRKPGAGWYVRLGHFYRDIRDQLGTSAPTARAAMRAADEVV